LFTSSCPQFTGRIISQAPLKLGQYLFSCAALSRYEEDVVELRLIGTVAVRQLSEDLWIGFSYPFLLAL